MKRLLNYLGLRPKSFHITAGLLTVVMIGLVDYFTGPEISMSIFYIFPISLAVWFVGPRSGIFIAPFGALCWLAADLAANAEYRYPATPYWNASVRLAVFLVVVWLLDRLRRFQIDLSVLVQQRTAALNSEIERREQLERELLQSTDQERERIGRDLHDGLCQHLATIAAAGSSLLEQHSENAEARKITQMVKQAIAESRLLVKGLFPAALEVGGLSAALNQLCSSVRTAFDVDCRLSGEQSVVIQDRQVAEHLFRIAQEAINNALKHAKPSRVVVGLTTSEQDIILIVKDDGGKQLLPFRHSEGAGLHIMAYRAKLIGASLVIEADPEGGTLVTCTVNLSTTMKKSQAERLSHASSDIS